MPIELDKTSPVEGTKTEDAAHKADESVVPTTTQDGKAPETVAKTEQQEEVVDLPGFSRREDGTWEFKIRGKDGEVTSVYTGKTPDEVMENLTDGIHEKDLQIRTSKARDAIRIPERAKEAVRPQDEDVPPNQDQIFTKYRNEAIASSGIPREYFSWTLKNWVDYADKNNLRDLEVQEVRNKIADVIKEADQRANSEYIAGVKFYVDSSIIREETEVVIKRLAKSGIDEKLFPDYEEFLDRVTSDPANRNKMTGALMPGRIVDAAIEEIEAIQKQTKTSAYRKKVEEDVAKAAAAKGKLPGAGSASQGSKESKAPEVAKDWDEVGRRAQKQLADWMAKQGT